MVNPGASKGGLFPVVVEQVPGGSFYIFLFYAFVVVLSFVFILCIPETKGKSLEEIGDGQTLH